MSRAFDPLRDRLLRAGVGGAPARRYLTELADHLEDLRDEERQAGGSPREAEARALRRLGDTEALADAMIARPEFQAWEARAPLAAYVLAPSAVLALATGFWLALLVAASVWLRHAAWAPGEGAASLRPLADALTGFSNSSLAILLGWGLAAYAIRRRAPLLWPVLGLLILAAAGAALQVEVTLPAAGLPGEIDLRPLALSGYLGRLFLDLALTAPPLAMMSLWQARNPDRRTMA